MLETAQQECEVLVRDAKELIRILDNKYIPDEVRLRKAYSLFTRTASFNYGEMAVLRAEDEIMFSLLCADIARKCEEFVTSSSEDIALARDIVVLIASVDHYILDLEKNHWRVGRKLSREERQNMTRAIRTTFHDQAEVRGHHVKIMLCGSLTKGFSDYKFIDRNFPRPVDYGLPKDIRDAVDTRIGIHASLKSKFSDVDLLIISKAIYDVVYHSSHVKQTYYLLGEKYPIGVGASKALAALHQKLSSISLGGIRGRWINFMLAENDAGAAVYFLGRQKEITALETRTGKKIENSDIVLIDEIIG